MRFNFMIFIRIFPGWLRSAALCIALVACAGGSGSGQGADAPPGLSLIAGDIGGNGRVDAAGTAARFTAPNAIAVDASDNLYVADTNNHTIRKIVTATGAVTTVAGVAGQKGVLLGDLPGSLSFPYGVKSIDPRTLALTTAHGVVRLVLP